jgi:hypothetical protein
MGCDIHVMVEVKTKGGWQSFDHPRIDRFYSLFARLANVRNYGDVIPLAEPRGVPDDCSEATRIYLDDDDFHSHSWVSSSEWDAIISEPAYGGKRGELSDVVPWELSDVSFRDERLLDYRLVFAFDN